MVRLSSTEFQLQKFNGSEPVTNFNKPNGGIEQYQMKQTPTMDVAEKPMEEDFLKFIHSEVMV